MIERRRTRQLAVGSVLVGGDAPVSVQSMTTTKTADVDGTLAQVYALRGAGADIVRITCNDTDAAQALAEIVPRSPVPIIADIHFQYRLALAALEAGVHGLRLNPGNIRKPEHIKAVAVAARERGIPIRVGVNAGSLDKELLEKHGGPIPEALVESALHEIRLLEEVDFTDIKISVKHSHVPSMVASYRLLAERTDYPFHLGVTEAGPPPAGLMKSVAGIATLLLEGIGDTIRFSLTADPVEEAEAGRRLLEQLGMRERAGLDLIACPSCGRAEVDVIAVAAEAQRVLEAEKLPIQVAVMGCVVNGPGEAREADIGIAAGKGGDTCSSRARWYASSPRPRWSRPSSTRLASSPQKGSMPGSQPPTASPSRWPRRPPPSCLPPGATSTTSRRSGRASRRWRGGSRAARSVLLDWLGDVDRDPPHGRGVHSIVLVEVVVGQCLTEGQPIRAVVHEKANRRRDSRDGRVQIGLVVAESLGAVRAPLADRLLSGHQQYFVNFRALSQLSHESLGLLGADPFRQVEDDVRVIESERTEAQTRIGPIRLRPVSRGRGLRWSPGRPQPDRQCDEGGDGECGGHPSDAHGYRHRPASGRPTTVGDAGRSMPEVVAGIVQAVVDGDHGASSGLVASMRRASVSRARRRWVLTDSLEMPRTSAISGIDRPST
jgi:(E)-4-hydroxy-3-methylbut-2-enyl-diphosphate synthase